MSNASLFLANLTHKAIIPIVKDVINSSLTTIDHLKDDQNLTTVAPLVETVTINITEEIALAERRATLHGDTSFVVISAALVFFMTPGLGYFYSGMARSKNALSLIFVCFLSMAVVLIQWTLFGFSLAFSESGGPFIGNFKYGGGTNIDHHHMVPAVSSVAFFIYQGMFATITPALMFGSSAERIRILPALLFMLIWTTIVYDPVAYWTWATNGWLNKMGSLDYAGGTPVHITSGFAGLAKALALGKRKGFADHGKEWKPHNLSNVFLGTAMLWFGWFGFNGGSALAGTSRAAMAASVTSIAAATGGLTWILFDYRHGRKLSALGFCSGAVAALVAITPGSGFVAPWAAIVIGFLAGLVCNLGCHLKHVLGYDDALDVFGTHGLGGFLGNILTGIFAQKWIVTLDDSAPIDGGWVDGHWMQVPYQLCGSVVGATWSFVITFLLVFIMDKIPFIHLRLKDEDQEVGVDLAEMGEVAYTMTDVVKGAARRLSSVFTGPSDFERRAQKQYFPSGRHPSYPNMGNNFNNLKGFRGPKKISEGEEEVDEDSVKHEDETHENGYSVKQANAKDLGKDSASEYSLDAY
jgi:Amt family ammonium transporter